MTRLDQHIVTQGFAPSRSKAKALVESGAVEVKDKNKNWVVTTQVSLEIEENAELRVSDHASLLKYVSRGGLKLEGALNSFNIQVRGKTVLDCGQSTGGFTDCCLQMGAAKVVGFDVGSNQLAPSLKEHSDVIYYENVHVHSARTHDELKKWIGRVDLLVADLSFISLLKVGSDLAAFSAGEMLILIKPQFELGPKSLNKKGVVKNQAGLLDKVWLLVKSLEPQMSYHCKGLTPSSLCGGDGNQEYFAYFVRPAIIKA